MTEMITMTYLFSIEGVYTLLLSRRERIELGIIIPNLSILHAMVLQEDSSDHYIWYEYTND